MAPDTTRAVIRRARDLFAPAPDLEITLEANPTSAETSVMDGFADAGINRLSLGIQALDDASLAALGRTHGADEARAAIEAAHARFPRVSFDLIYARPGQTAAAWREELARALEHVRGHLSVYQLTIEPGTPFFLAAARGALETPDEDSGAEMFEVTHEILEAAGLPAYEISNHAEPGSESRHNLTYWRHGDYLGIGPGAHGRIADGNSVHETRQHRAPEIWLARTQEAGHATRRDTPLSADALVEEVTMMGLRLREGIDRDRFFRRTGRHIGEVFSPDAVARLVAGGYVADDSRRLRATRSGQQRLNAVIDTLLNSSALSS